LICYCFYQLFQHRFVNSNPELTIKYLTWQDLIRDKKYTQQRISEWRIKFKDNEVFTDTISKIYDELANRLFRAGLSGKSNTAMAIFGLKNNYGWSDKKENNLIEPQKPLIIDTDGKENITDNKTV